MINIKLKSVLSFLVAVCIVLVTWITHTQPGALADSSSAGDRPQTATPVITPETLAQEVLSNIAMPQHYNLYLSNVIDFGFGSEILGNEKFLSWIEGLFAQESGWSHVAEDYIAQLEASFSEDELKELMPLVQNPLLQRLRQAELDAYIRSRQERRELIFRLWENYNNGQFSPPPDVWE